MIKKILVPVDGSEHSNKAIDLSVNMTMQNDSALYFLHVARETEIPNAILDYMRSEGIKESAHSVYLQVVENQIITPAKDKAIEKGVKDIKTSVIYGDPAEGIINYATDHGVDMIVLGSRGVDNPKSPMLGSVSCKVSHSADQTCMIVRKTLLEGKKILIVDDEPDVLETLEELLSMCDVMKASNFDGAEKLLETRHFDIAILDIMGVNGYKLLEIAKDKNVISLMLTANALSPDDTVKSFRKGAASYVPKDKIGNITIFLTDILEAKRKGEKYWWRWLDRLGSFYNRRFGSDWQKKDEQFWKNHTFGL